SEPAKAVGDASRPATRDEFTRTTRLVSETPEAVGTAKSTVTESIHEAVDNAASSAASARALGGDVIDGDSSATQPSVQASVTDRVKGASSVPPYALPKRPIAGAGRTSTDRDEANSRSRDSLRFAPMPRSATPATTATTAAPAMPPLAFHASNGALSPLPIAATTSEFVSVPADAETELTNQTVQAMRLQWNQGVGDAQIRLRPEFLGDLSISIRVENGAVTASLASEAAVVREWIEAHVQTLRDALAGQGLNLEKLIVDETDKTHEHDSREGRRQQP